MRSVTRIQGWAPAGAVQDESGDDAVRISSAATVRPDEGVPTSAALRGRDPVRREGGRNEHPRNPRRGAPVPAEPRTDSAGPAGDGIELVEAGLRPVERTI